MLARLNRIRRRDRPEAEVDPQSEAELEAAAFPGIVPAAVPGSVLFRQAHIGADSDVLIVGDSHTLLCGAHYAYPTCDVDAIPGRVSAEALEIIDRFLRPRHTVIVWEIATNDVGYPPGYEENLKLLHERAAGRQLVLVNTWRRDGGNTHEHVNAALLAFHEAHPQDTIHVDWAAHVESFEELPLGLVPDYVHFTPAAYEGRIGLVSEAIAEARARVAAGPPPERLRP